MENLQNDSALDLKTKIPALLNYLRQEKPLIHCITNPISINDCANILLALGARPIMAEHPAEVMAITKQAQALALNLGNITDARMESMDMSGSMSVAHSIPLIVDMVGISCSPFRLKYLKDNLLLHVVYSIPSVAKGNISELRALFDMPVTPGMGVDADDKEMVTAANAKEYAEFFREQAYDIQSIIMATGPIDLIVGYEEAYTIANGTEALASITGTGCMLNVLTAACLAATRHIENFTDVDAAICASLILGIAAENAHHFYVNDGPGTFHYKLMDSIHKLTAEDIITKAKITKLDLCD